MAKRRKTYSRPRRAYRWVRRRLKGKKIPLEVAIGGVAIPFTPAASGFATPAQCVSYGDWTGLADSLKVGFLGFDPSRDAGTFNLAGLINPFDMEHGRYTKMLIYAGLVSKIRKRLVHIPFEKVPLVGRYIS